KKLDEFFDGETCLADDRAQRAAVEFFVIGDGGLRGRRLANQDDVTAALTIDFKANLFQRLNTLCAGNEGSLLTRLPRPALCDRRAPACRARARLLRAGILLRARLPVLHRASSLG